MGQRITCTCAGVYSLTRGREYELIAHNLEKNEVRVRSDRGRSNWIPSHCFDLKGGPVPVLTAWRFDDLVIDEINGRDETNNWVDIVLQFDDGIQRWCQMVTPDYLKGLVQNPFEPMFYSNRLIVVRDLATATVEQVLRHLNQQ
jgi:hypothetical protein